MQCLRSRLAPLAPTSRTCVVVALTLTVLAQSLSWAQDSVSLDEAIATAGVTTISPVSGEPWAYLLLQPTQLELALGSAFAIYRKPGNAASAEVYTRLGVIGLTEDDRVIASLQPRAAHLGGDLDALDDSLTGMFRGLIPEDTLSTAQKLAAVIVGAVGRAEHQSTLFLLARRHPLVSMTLGLAHASPMPAPGVFTYEVREFDTRSETDLRVIGRVTLDATQPLTLPAPGPPVEVQIGDARDHLNIRLRWSSPPDLRRASLLQYGFDVFRIPKAVADGLAIQSAAPSLDTLLQLVDDGNPATGLRVNANPILPQQLYSDNDVGDPMDDTVFIMDDNRRQDPFLARFQNGDQFYYYALARDLLGHPGTPSPALLATVCDRYRPSAPFGITVANHIRYDDANQSEIVGLDLSWRASEDPDSGTESYHVYRWDRTQDVHVHAGDPVYARIGEVAHEPNRSVYHFIDTSSELSTHPGRTYFYTVRTLDRGACGGNLSVNSGPVPGTLRNHNGPPAPAGQVEVTCYLPQVSFSDYAIVDAPGSSPINPRVDFVCRVPSSVALGAELSWAEFSIENTVIIGRAAFQADGAGGYVAQLRASASKATPSCRVGTRSGLASNVVFATQPLPLAAANKGTVATFTATLVPTQTETGGACGDGHELHDPATGETNLVCVLIDTPAGATEYRVYRQVDEAEPVLIETGPSNPEGDSLTIKDAGLPSGASTCYYVQVLDRDGNPSPMVPVGDCVRTLSSERMPVPVLDTPEAAGTTETPKMRVRWHASPHGVQRFELWIAPESGQAPGTTGTTLHGDIAATHPNVIPTEGGKDFMVFETPRLEAIPDADNGIFEFDLHVLMGETYTLLVRAVGSGAADARVLGDFSNDESFAWVAPPTPPGPNVPWPARGWPQARPASDFHPSVEAIQLPDLLQWEGAVGIRIGEYRYNGSKYLVPSQPGPFGGVIHTIGGEADPHSYLFRNEAITGDEDSRTHASLLPCALYRYRIRDEGPTDLVQVSPMMESMAYGFGNDPVEGVITHIYDPFIAAAPKPENTPADLPNYDLYLVDRTPVIAGARYRYLLVRFATDGEMKQVYTLETSPIVP